jgi:prepilin-type N-terminal cleavage/methylation domain-containing protein
MKARGGFTLIEVLLAAIILGLGISGILVSMSQAQRFMQTMPDLLTAQEVMDMGDMAYPLAETEKAEDIDISERDVDELWRDISGANGPQMTREQSEKYHGYTWKREDLDATTSEDDLKRVGYIHRVRITVTWGDRFRGEKNTESYVSLWRDPQNAK